jgi:NAD(P)-binding Rossmann-like domain
MARLASGKRSTARRFGGRRQVARLIIIPRPVTTARVYRLKVIGGELAALTAAVALAKRGARVELFEKPASAGVLYCDGGWQAMIELLAASASNAGVRIQIHTIFVIRNLDRS